MAVVNLVKLTSLVVEVNVVKVTGSLVVINVVKITSLVGQVKMVKMTGFVVVVNVVKVTRLQEGLSRLFVWSKWLK